MKRIKVSKVAVLEENRLGVFPATSSSSYQYVYREAAEVNWNPELQCFLSGVPRKWDHKEWYGHIVTVVLSGLGIRLVQSSRTAFVPDDPAFIADMRDAEAEAQKWIDVERPKIMRGEQSTGE